jgi:hypothetical protein
MFEKVAEEYAEKTSSLAIKKFNPLEPKLLAIGFQDGAEFGYNKANEWHYAKDGDLPKETGLLMSKTLLLVTKMKGSDCLSLALGEYNFSTQEFSYQHIVGLTDVIAWKEIVLPELKESE